MVALAEAVLFTAGLLAACVGVGGSTLRWARLDEPGEIGAARRLSLGVSAALGIAILIALGGIGTVLRVPVVLSITVFVMAGIGLLVAHLVRVRPRWTAIWLVVLGVEVIALGLVLVTQAGIGLAFPLNTCDDILAYLPEARRLLITRTLLEPWSTRRLQNFGGQTFLQASYIRFLGKDALGLAETLLPTALLWLLFTTALRRPLTRILSLVPLIFLPFFDVPRMNTAGALSPVPLLVALGILVLILRLAAQSSNQRGRVVAAAAIGVTAAAVVALRTSVAPAVALIVVVSAVMVPGTRRNKVRTVAICVGSGIAAFMPWSIAMWESSSTPLYPLLRGNENQRVPSIGGNQSVGVGELFSNAWHFASNCTYPLALLILLLIAFATRRVLPWTAPTAALMSAAGLFNMMLLTVSLSLVAPREFDRYTFPLAGGALFFLLRGSLVRLDEEPSMVARSVARPALLTVATLAVFFWLGTSRPQATKLTVPNIDTARDYVESATNIDPDERVTPGASVDRARRVLAAVPPGARTILAVSDPDAFLTAGFALQSMDQPGLVAPGGRFPFFSGPEAKVRALREHGYDFLIVTPSRGHPCFESEVLKANFHSDSPGIRAQAPYFLDFYDDMDSLAQRYPAATRVVDGLYVIDLRAVPGTTPGRGAATRRDVRHLSSSAAE
jgi:hypothetical protein